MISNIEVLDEAYILEDGVIWSATLQHDGIIYLVRESGPNGFPTALHGEVVHTTRDALNSKIKYLETLKNFNKALVEQECNMNKLFDYTDGMKERKRKSQESGEVLDNTLAQLMKEFGKWLSLNREYKNNHLEIALTVFFSDCGMKNISVNHCNLLYNVGTLLILIEQDRVFLCGNDIKVSHSSQVNITELLRHVQMASN